MPAATRSVGDETEGICDIGCILCKHDRNGINIQGSEDVFINILQAHRLTDIGYTRCFHKGIYKSIEGSPDTFTNTLKQTRIKDATLCILCDEIGKHKTGSPDVFVNGY